jgi:Skp family chaperone for outer membrane proteins
MQLIKRTPGIAAVVIVAALAAFLTYEVVASRSAQPRSCACVVTVSLPTVLEGLDERIDAQRALGTLAEGMQAEDEARQLSLRTLRDEFDQIPAGDIDRMEQTTEHLALMALEYQAWRAYATEQLDIEKSLMLRELDRKIVTAITELSQVNQYDVVLLDDSGQELMVNAEAQMPRELQIRQQIMSRRALYTSDAADITDELIERMNNAYDAGS